MKRFMKQLHRDERGLTLIELLIVVAILGILAAVIVPNLMGFITTGEVAAANTEVANVESAALAYFADNDGLWPPSSADLVTGNYLSAAPNYAVYGFDEYGRVDTATEILPAADSITWVAADHKWIKSP